MSSALCYTKVGGHTMRQLIRDRICARVKKEKIVNTIKTLTYWSIVSGIIYVHAINNAIAQRNRTDW
jgi:hypothetical protein